MAKKNNANFLVLVIVLILFFGIASAIIAPRVYNSSSVGGDTHQIQLPTVNSTIRSADGQYHNLQTKFTLAFEKGKTRNINTRDLYAHIEDIMANIEFEKASGADGGDYIKGQVREGLAGYIDEDSLKGIYITALQSDAPSFNADDSIEKIQHDNVFRGLFGN